MESLDIEVKKEVWGLRGHEVIFFLWGKTLEIAFALGANGNFFMGVLGIVRVKFLKLKGMIDFQ